MKSFIVKIIYFSIAMVISCVSVYFCLDAYLNRSFHSENAVFIWGDSQAYRGIDIDELSNKTGKNIYTSAVPGAGVYDFLLFTEQVAENAEVIVSLSKLVQIRRKENDFNQSGLSVKSLKKMYENNYSFKEVFSILNKNLQAKSNIKQESALFSFADTIVLRLPLSHFESYYQETPTFLEDKQELYLLGIKNLIAKNCKISFLEFPFHKDLKNIENQSPIKIQTEEFKLDVLSLFKEGQIDTIALNKDKNIFKDLSHLNIIGAKELSIKLGIKLANQESTTMYIVN